MFGKGRCNEVVAIHKEMIRRTRPFAITYSLLSLVSILRTIGKKGSPTQRFKRILRILLKPSPGTLKLSLFPAVLPFLYQTLLSLVRRTFSSIYTNEIAALLTSPAILLLPHGLRVYLALYTVTSAMSTFFKSPSPKQMERKSGAGERGWRNYLPPITLVNALGNSWMVWSWYHEKGVFPRSYEKLILDQSPHYFPKDRPAFETRDFLETTLNPRIANALPGEHRWLVCNTLHPDEPSCIKNYVKGWIDGVPQCTRWVAGFGALNTLIGFKKRILSQPLLALRDWIEYVVRGVLYVNGSVQTVWAVTCLLQRVFPGNFMPKSRWVINGSIASLWIYALPPKRQAQISVYVGRIGALSVWRAYLNHGGIYLPGGEVLFFAAGWSALLRLREGGWKIEGLMRRAIKFVEGREEELKQNSSTWSPDVSRAPSTEHLNALSLEKGEVGIEIEERGRRPDDRGAMKPEGFEVVDSGFGSAEDDDKD